MARPLLILGTHNRKKGIELVDLLAPVGLELRTLADLPDAIEVVEDGDTFQANARKKAIEQAIHLKKWVLGEDSGLAVDALGGLPGVYSARYSGAGATDDSNNQKLLLELAEAPPSKRAAHYVCHAVIASPVGEIMAEAVGYCHGVMLATPAGAGGFGYDPLFEIREYHRTFGELGSTAKACLSHRARAIGQLIPRLRQLVAAGEWT
ncbi:MAG: non-canonical purine NTP pyrophosphatase [Pirellulales bacterium]|nr:non-canonical purine NTP pyrophosphatase [Pirellulales bacterium]